MLSLYLTLGILLLIGERNSASQSDRLRRVVELCARRWYGDHGVPDASEHEHLLSVAVLAVIGVALIVLAPAKRSRKAAICSRCRGSHPLSTFDM
jgi:hypothetical protein